MQECPFCGVEIKEPNRTIECRELACIVHSKYPVRPGHLLVIPRRHVEFLRDLSKEERNELFDVVDEYQQKVLAKFSSGADVSLHTRPFLPQGKYKVDHLHFHIIPRDFQDDIWQVSGRHLDSLYYEISDEEIAEVRQKLVN